MSPYAAPQLWNLECTNVVWFIYINLWSIQYALKYVQTIPQNIFLLCPREDKMSFLDVEMGLPAPLLSSFPWWELFTVFCAENWYDFSIMFYLLAEISQLTAFILACYKQGPDYGLKYLQFPWSVCTQI